MMAGSTNVGFFTVYYISICDFWALFLSRVGKKLMDIKKTFLKLFFAKK
jgi:hypothetical protein